MRIAIKDTVLGSKPCNKTSEILLRLSLVIDAETLSVELDLINFDEIDEEVSVTALKSVYSQIV